MRVRRSLLARAWQRDALGADGGVGRVGRLRHLAANLVAHLGEVGSGRLVPLLSGGCRLTRLGHRGGGGGGCARSAPSVSGPPASHGRGRGPACASFPPFAVSAPRPPACVAATAGAGDTTSGATRARRLPARTSELPKRQLAVAAYDCSSSGNSPGPWLAATRVKAPAVSRRGGVMVCTSVCRAAATRAPPEHRRHRVIFSPQPAAASGVANRGGTASASPLCAEAQWRDATPRTFLRGDCTPRPAAPDARRGSRGAPARSYEYLKDSLRSLKLNTVCEEAKCPNIGEARPRRRCRTLTRALAAADARSRLPRSAGTAIWGRRR